MLNIHESSDLLLDEIDANDMSLDEEEEGDEENLDDTTAGWHAEEDGSE